MVVATAVTPVQRCHASDGVASTNGAVASTQPAISVRAPVAAPIRTLATAMARQLTCRVRIAMISAPAAASTSAIGKCTRSGCSFPISNMCLRTLQHVEVRRACGCRPERPRKYSRPCASALFLSSAVSISANEPLTMVVSPVQSFAPTNLTIRVQMEPDAGNRAFEVIAESGEYYRSSRIQLDGADAPRTIWLEIRNLPRGDYDVRGALLNSAGRERCAVREHVIVLGFAGT